MKLKLALLTGLVSLTACNNMQQDPLAGASDAVRSGRPPTAAKPVQDQALDKNALQIDAPSLVNGRIGSAIEFKILGRIMTPGMDFEISVDNLSELPGATFDPVTGDFKWTPAKAIMGSFPSIELPLRITMATIPTEKNPTVSVERKTIAMVIVNVYSKPIVNTVGGSTPLLTGTRYVMPFQLEDVDALHPTEVSVDVRDCNSNSYATSIAHLVTVRNIQADGTTPHKFKGEAILNLASADNLISGSYCFGLMAVSKHGVPSDVYQKNFSIEAKMKATRVTTERTPDLPVGTKTAISFSVYDPSGAGNVTLKSIDDVNLLLPGSSLACTQSWATKYQLDCNGVLDTTNVVPGTYSLKFVVDNSGTRSTQKTTTNHVLRIIVKAANP